MQNRVLAIVFCLAAVFCWVLAAIQWQRLLLAKSLGQSGAGVAATVTRKLIYGPAPGHCQIDYIYYVEGQQFEGSSEVTNARYNQLRTGRSISVTYPPGHPNSAVFEPENAAPLAMEQALGGTGVGAVAFLVAWGKYKKSQT